MPWAAFLRVRWGRIGQARAAMGMGGARIGVPEVGRMLGLT